MLIFLIGFMGSGKSTLGKELADMMDYPFIDMDDVLQQQEGMTIPDMFSGPGEAFFREKEHELLLSLLGGVQAIVATGGGTPCFFDHMKLMNKAGVTVYIKVSEEVLYERLKDETGSRPLLKGSGPVGLKGFISSHLSEREKYYNQAKIVYDPVTSELNKLIQRFG